MQSTRTNRSSTAQNRRGEEGFLLIALVVAVFLLALFLTIAAPTAARSLERDREVESEHRAQEYVRAIHNYYLKFNAYPNSLEQLLSANNQHFLRQQYKDPLTGGDYRLIHFGEAKTQVKGFFGEPLDGLTQGGLGSLSGSASQSGISPAGAGATGFGQTGGFGSSGSSGSAGGFSLSSSSNSTMGGNSSTSSGASGTGSTDATKFQGSKGMIVGVASTASGHGLVEWNGSTNIEDWEFLYDHRTWLLKQRVNIFGGGMTVSSGANSAFGSNTPSFNNTAGAGTTTSGAGNGSTGAGTSSGSGTSGTNPQP